MVAAYAQERGNLIFVAVHLGICGYVLRNAVKKKLRHPIDQDDEAASSGGLLRSHHQ